MNVASSVVLANQPVTSEGIVAASVYMEGRRVANIAIDEASSWRSKPGHVVWIGLHEPDMPLLTSVQRQFQLHDLAVEDANNAHQRPKIEQYGDGLFIVARTAQLIGDTIAFGETHLFVGEGYLVSVRHGASTSYKPVRERCESCPRALARGEDYILYAILDFIVDNYSPVLETIQEEVEAMEQDDGLAVRRSGWLHVHVCHAHVLAVEHERERRNWMRVWDFRDVRAHRADEMRDPAGSSAPARG